MEKITFNTLDQEDLIRVSGQMTTLIDSEASIKSASSDAITRDMIRDHKPDKDHFLLHVVALGDEEHYGYNRNGDSWPKEGCQKYHNTFVTHGCFYREHKNTDPEKYGIGSIKASSYNEDMGRIELIVHGHKKKAEDVYEMAKKGETISVSMSAHVPYDVSSITGKKAKTPAEYDEYCKYRMTQWIPEHQKFAHVSNPIAKWFDISKVANPADRIAHHLEIHTNEKCASSREFIGGARLAELEGVKTPTSLLNAGVMDITKRAFLEKLEDLETTLNDKVFYKQASGNLYHYVNNVASKAFTEQLTEQELESCKACEPGVLFRKLATNKILLPLESFYAYAYGKTMKEAAESEVVKQAKQAIPTIFANLKQACGCQSIENLFDHGPMFMDMFGTPGVDSIDNFMSGIKNKLSIGQDTVKDRVIKITIHIDASPVNPPKENLQVIKLASSNLEAKALCETYAMYKLSALKSMQELTGNDITDSELVLTAFQNR